MTSDTILAAAQAGFRAYFSGRPWHHWDTVENATRIRWEELAARVLNGNYTTARQCHRYYSEDRAGYVEWESIKPGSRVRWRQVLEAMQTVGRNATRMAA